MQHESEMRNNHRTHFWILAPTYLFLYGPQLRHPTPAIRNYRTGLPRTIPRTQWFYYALPGIRRRFTSLPGARYSVRLAQRGMLRRRRYSRRPSPVEKSLEFSVFAWFGGKVGFGRLRPQKLKSLYKGKTESPDLVDFGRSASFSIGLLTVPTT